MTDVEMGWEQLQEASAELPLAARFVFSDGKVGAAELKSSGGGGKTTAANGHHGSGLSHRSFSSVEPEFGSGI